MKKTYTKKQITEAIAYWEKRLEKMNEANELTESDSFDHITSSFVTHGYTESEAITLTRLILSGVRFTKLMKDYTGDVEAYTNLAAKIEDPELHRAIKSEEHLPETGLKLASAI